MWLAPSVSRQYSKCSAAIGLLAPQPLDDLGLGRALARPGNGRQHGIGDQLGRDAQLLEFCVGVLMRAHALQHAGRIDELGIRQRLAEQRVGIRRQKAGSMPMRAPALPIFLRCSTASIRRIERAPAGWRERRRPERMVLVLAAFHAVGDIGGMLRPALLIDDNRQIAAVADRIHGGEEDELVAAEQILGVVLGGGEQHVDPGLLHQPVEPGLVERDVADCILARGDVHFSLPELPGQPVGLPAV